MRRGCSLLAVLLALLGGHATVCRAQAQGIAPFRLTGIEGYASVRYLGDEFTSRQPGGRSRQALGDLREEVFVMTHSYVYHPNFLTLDLGAGPILQRGHFSGDAGAASASSTLYNLSTRATFLRDKPYRGSLFYEHLNPTLAVSPGSIMTQENTRYGFDLSTLAPLPINVDATRFRSLGSSVDRVVDDRIDQFNLRASQPIGRIGLTQFSYQSADQESMSGSPALPIQRTSFDRRYYQLDTRLRLGEREQYDLYNLIGLDNQSFGISQADLPERRDRRFLLDARGRHSERLNSFASYNHNSSAQGSLSSNANAASAGLNYLPTPEVSLRLAGRAEDNRTTQFTARSRGGDGAVDYRRPLPLGLLSAGYAVRYDQRDQQAAAPQASVIGERITLSGTTPVPLAQQRVVPGSVVVSDVARTQTFVEGLDYQLSVVGLVTRVQRLVGGSILDGQEVLVDYVHDVGGTFAFNEVDQILNLSWGLASYFSLYFRYFDAAPRLTSGTPTTPLNTVHSTLYGARADVPLALPVELMLGGLYEQELRRETIAPYRRQQYELYGQTEAPPFLGRGNVRLTTRRVNQDFENSPQSVRLTGYDLTLSARHPWGIDLFANATYERDTGTLVPRARLLATARALWRYRQASFSVDLTRLRETQGEFETTRRLVQMLFRRDF